MANDTDCLTSNELSDKNTGSSKPFEVARTPDICMAATSESPTDCLGTNGVDDNTLPNGCVNGLHTVCNIQDPGVHINNNVSPCDGMTTDGVTSEAIVSTSKNDPTSNGHTVPHCCSLTTTADASLLSASMDDSGTADLSYIPPSSCGIVPSSVDGEITELTARLAEIGNLSLTASGVPCVVPADNLAVDSEDSNGIRYVVYESESQMEAIMQLITKDLSEPYSIYTYRYFIHNWPRLCFLAMDKEKYVGAIVCKLDRHKTGARRGYIAMLAVDHEYRRMGIGSNLVVRSIKSMMNPVGGGCDEVVLETEISNSSALHLYEKLGFVRDKRLFRYYLNGVDALRLKLWLR